MAAGGARVAGAGCAPQGAANGNRRALLPPLVCMTLVFPRTHFFTVPIRPHGAGGKKTRRSIILDTVAIVFHHLLDETKREWIVQWAKCVTLGVSLSLSLSVARSLALACSASLSLFLRHMTVPWRTLTIVRCVCRELDLGGLSKPGHPGLVIIEGEVRSVDLFIQRIRSDHIKWKTMEMACEEQMEVCHNRIVRSF